MSRRRAARGGSSQGHRFRATIYTVGINRCIDVPEVAGAAFQGRYVPVRGRCDGRAFRGTLVPRGGGRHRLFLNGPLRAAIGADIGDSVRLELLPATPSRLPPLPADLARALRASPGARLAFESSTPARRCEILTWLARARHQETRVRRIALVIRRLK